MKGRELWLGLFGLALGWGIAKTFLSEGTFTSSKPDTEVESVLGKRTAHIPAWLEDQWNEDLPEHLQLRALATHRFKGKSPQFGDLLKHILRQPQDLNHPNPLLRHLLAEWIAQDPLDSFEQCKSLPEPRHRKAALREWARQWAEVTDPDAILDRLHKLFPETKDLDDKYALLSGITETIAAEHADKALAMMTAFEMYPDNGIEAVAQVSPELVAELILSGVDLYIPDLMRPWTKQDPDRAIAFVNALDEKTQERFIEPLCRELARHDPARAFEVLGGYGMTSDPFSKRHRILKWIAGDWARQDPQGAAEWALALEGEKSRNNALREVSLEIREHDPELAVEVFLRSNPNDGDDSGKHVFRSLAQHDWDQALAVAKAAENASIRAQAFNGLLRHLGDTGVEVNVDELPAILSLAEEAGASGYTGILRKLDEATRNEFINTYPELLKESVNELVDGLSWGDPQAALRLAESLPSISGEDEGIQQAVTSLAETDPHEAVHWVNEMAPGETQVRAIQNLVHNWSRYDAAATRDWIASLTSQDTQEHAAEAFIRSNAVRDSASAWELSGMMTSARFRLEMQQLVLRGWIERDPQAAQAALSKLPNPVPELQEAFEAALEKRQVRQHFLLGDEGP